MNPTLGLKKEPSMKVIQLSAVMSSTCIFCAGQIEETKRWKILGQRKSGLIRQVTSQKRFNSYEIFYDSTGKDDV